MPSAAADDGFGKPAATAPFAPEVYRERRQRLMAQMKSGVAVLYAANPAESEFVTFRQDADFAWLTGLQDEARTVLHLSVDGRFTPEQRDIYDTVLRAQETGMAALKAGAIYEDVHRSARRAGSGRASGRLLARTRPF